MASLRYARLIWLGVACAQKSGGDRLKRMEVATAAATTAAASYVACHAKDFVVVDGWRLHVQARPVELLLLDCAHATLSAQCAAAAAATAAELRAAAVERFRTLEPEHEEEEGSEEEQHVPRELARRLA
jgi:hypothetical protein